MDPNSLVLAKYNAIDSAVTRECFPKLREEAKEGGYLDIIEQTDALCDVLLYMAIRGILIDKDALIQLTKEVENEIELAQKELDELCGIPLNTSSPKQCVQYFYGILGLPPYTSRKTGSPTTDDKAMARIARKGKKGSKEAKLVQQVRGLRKLYGTYLTVVVDDDGRVRSSFNPRGTTAGRISSSQTIFGTGMNFQNIDPRFKRFMVADPGHIMFEIDKKQAEWVVTAYVSGDADMIHVIEEGIDPHVYTGSKISRLPLEIVEAEAQVVGHATDPHEIEELRRQALPELFDGTFRDQFLPRIFSIRQAGKKSNHGLNYGMGYVRFALENEMMEREAKPIVMAYRNGYPGLINWWDQIKRKLSRDRTLENCFGRKRRFLGEMDYHTFESAISFIPQSTVGDLVNIGLTNIYATTSPFMYKVDMLNQVHDSILGQYPINDWQDMGNALKVCEGMIDPVIEYRNRPFKIPSELTLGLNWGDYDKRANPTGMKPIELLSTGRDLSTLLEKWYVETTA